MWTIPAKSQQLPVSNEPIQNRLPCLDSSSECIDLLTEKAIEKQSKLENQLTEAQTFQQELLRKILSLIGFA